MEDTYPFDDLSAGSEKLTTVREQDEDLKWVCSTKQGRRFIGRLFDMAGLYRSTYSDSHAFASLQEGRRQMGLELLSQLDTVCPEQYMKLINERIERATHG